MDVTMRIRATAEMQANDRYVALPFELPAGATTFEVTLGVDDVPGAVVDLGCEGPDGWRGWSGGARRSFVVGEDDATPGYLPGTLTAGSWRVILGLHSLPPGGVDLTVTVSVPARHAPEHGTVETPVERASRGGERDLPAPDGLCWFAGDTHAHSLHSDGALSLWELANEGVRSGLDFLCVTDHNTTSHHAHLPTVGSRHGITLVPGQEVTTHQGHANAYGDIGFVDFREHAQTWVHTVARRGGFMSINHPVDGDCAWQYGLSEEPGGVELFHSTWYREPISKAALAWFQRWRRDSVLLGGGDFHNRSTSLRPGMPTTWVAAEECSPDAILAGIRAGRTTITGSVAVADGVGRPVLDGAPILIRQGDALLVGDAVGLTLISASDRRQVVSKNWETVVAPIEQGPYRVEDSRRMTLALCR